MDQRLSLVTLGVADLKRSAAFYENGLGWKRHAGPDSVVFFQMPGMVFALWRRDQLAEDAGAKDAGVKDAGARNAGAAFSGIALAHNVASRAEVDLVLAQARAAGGRIAVAPHETFWGGYSGYFADLDGHLWEIAHNPFWTLNPDGAVTLG